MMDIDVDEKSVTLDLPQALYSREGIGIAAQIFANQAAVLLGEDDGTFQVVLESKRKAPKAPELSGLGGEFLNELLNQEYRMLVGRFNRKITNLTATQALLAARGGENPAPAPEQEKTPEFLKAVEELMREAQAEIDRTMPKKLPPQGTPLPPLKGDAGA